MNIPKHGWLIILKRESFATEKKSSKFNIEKKFLIPEHNIELIIQT